MSRCTATCTTRTRCPTALAGCRAAYYLVHSLDSKDFERLDAEAARAFGQAAAEAGVQQIIYLGGLGSESDELSSHLRSRREVEGLLGAAGVPVTVLRAGIIVGHGGISWEMTRQLVEHLPAMVTPKWVRTRTQPIAVADVVRYLVGVLDEPRAVGRVFEIGGPEVLEYVTMLRRVARIKNTPAADRARPAAHPGPVVAVAVARHRRRHPDRPVAGRLDEPTRSSCATTASRRVVPFEPMGYDDAVRVALAEHAATSEPR